MIHFRKCYIARLMLCANLGAASRVHDYPDRLAAALSLR
jgi:hypothetical protein